MGYDGSGQTMIVVVGRRLSLPWNFADDELGACARCGAFARYRPRAPAAGVLVCATCFGPPAAPGDVWILPGAPLDARQGVAS
jgi:hypothetical protein